MHSSSIPMRATFSVHFILLDLITLIMFGEEYKLLSFSSSATLTGNKYKILRELKEVGLLQFWLYWRSFLYLKCLIIVYVYLL
jgi:hypothetical protein